MSNIDIIQNFLLAFLILATIINSFGRGGDGD